MSIVKNPKDKSTSNETSGSGNTSPSLTLSSPGAVTPSNDRKPVVVNVGETIRIDY